MTETIHDNSYDAMPYKDWPYAFTHARHLEAMAALFGMSPRDIEHCRVLELGCAGGGNLIPQAVDLPESEFIGLDLSKKQLEAGTELVQSLGLKNVSLRHADILDVDASWGQFDYIVAHGIYSWVPVQVRRKILEVCGRNLAPQGVAYISYNTYPGWHFAGVVRDMMRYHASAFPTPQQQVAQAKAILELAAELAPQQHFTGQLFREELETIRKVANDSYVYHEHLEENNVAIYFHEFMREAEGQGLQYLGDAEFSTMIVGNWPQKARTTFASLPRVQQEQYVDFIRGRRFRKTLLCHSEVPLSLNIHSDLMLPFHFALAGKLEHENVDLRSTDRAVFRVGGSQLETYSPLVKAAMIYLQESVPRHIGFHELFLTARARTVTAPAQGGPESPVSVLANALLSAFTVDMLTISLHPPRCTKQIDERPKASPLARWQAAHGLPLTNQCHQVVNLNLLARRMLRRLDGSHNRRDLVEACEEAIAAGELNVRIDGKAKQDLDRRVLQGVIDQTLTEISNAGLLVG